MIFKRQVLLLVASFLILTGQGCGRNEGTSIGSKAFNPSTASLFDFFLPSAFASAGLVSSFKFCVTQLKLEAADGSGIQHDGKELLEAKLGLVDLQGGSTSVNWGELDLPTGTEIKKIKIEIHKDAELCGVQYSANINGQTLEKDLEFKFVFVNPRSFEKGASITVALDTIVSRLEQAVQAGQLDDEHISSYLDDSCEDDAE